MYVTKRRPLREEAFIIKTFHRMEKLQLGGVVVLILALVFGYYLYTVNIIPEVPELQDTFWGPGPPKEDDTAIRKFKIYVSNPVLEDLMRRLNNTRQLPPPLEGMGFQYGVNTDFLNSMIGFWKSEYKWRERETYLNKFPQYETQIFGLKIHFIHAKPDSSKLKPGQQIVPLLLLHGWPGSVREFYELIPFLITPRQEEKFVFEVIVPSLPGFGFSEAAAKPGLGYAHVAVIMKKLMERLGFNQFYLQGGGLGAAIGMSMAVFYPESVQAYHSNFCFIGSKKAQMKLILGYVFPSLIAEEGHVEHLAEQISFIIEESGFFHIQATKPDTVGIGLTDSPSALLAYILEKISVGTNHSWRQKTDGGLNHFNRANLLDNVMVYWITNSITSSMRLFSESFNNDYFSLKLWRIPINVPTGCARFPGEVVYFPRSLIEDSYPKLIRLTDMPKGGHFAAFEVPDLLAEDIWQFVSTARKRSNL